MKIPIKHAIDSGAWFQCVTETHDGPFIFNIRILSFKKVPNNIMRELQKDIRFDDGILWLLGIEAVNLNKAPFSAWHVQNQMMLFDQDDFKFAATSVSELASTDFGERIGIKRFSGWSSVPELTPKIKATGAIPYLLPDDDAEYSFSVEGGNIKEV